MAELAIPILALGGLYIISQDSNKKNNSKKENYENLNKMKITSKYPNPGPVSENNINYYANSNQATDKYFSQENYKNMINNCF